MQARGPAQVRALARVPDQEEEAGGLQGAGGARAPRAGARRRRVRSRREVRGLPRRRTARLVGGAHRGGHDRVVGAAQEEGRRGVARGTRRESYICRQTVSAFFPPIKNEKPSYAYTPKWGFSSDAFPPLRSDGAGCVLCPRSRDIRADGHRVGVPPRDQKRGRRRQGASHQPLPALARPFRATLADPEIVAPPQADFSTEQLDEKALATLATVRRRPHAPRARDASPNVPDLRFPLSARSSGSTS